MVVQLSETIGCSMNSWLECQQIHPIPEAPRGSQGFPDAPRGCQRLPEAARGWSMGLQLSETIGLSTKSLLEFQQMIT